MSVGHARKGLEFPVNYNPGPGGYDPTDTYRYLSVNSSRTTSFGKEKRTLPLEETIDHDIPGPIYTPTVHFVSKINPTLH